MKGTYLLFDCDNFFVSCERAFQPKLKNIPVVVLSNNDGCVVSRSNEAKKVGIKMCTPYFKIADTLKAMGGKALSSNYELYADMSNRVMSLLRTYFNTLEIYSIDEAFTHTEDMSDLTARGLKIRNDILQQTGISVSVGIAPSKTLCKVAGEQAKTFATDKVLHLQKEEEIKQVLAKLDATDIWGIGKNLNAKLNFLGIFTALELYNMPLSLARKKFGINLERTILELRGYSCLEEDKHEAQKSIICSRSFEHEIYSFDELKTILADFVNVACQRLRKQKSLASGLIVGIESNRFKENFYQNSHLVSLRESSANTARFIEAMNEGLKRIYKTQIGYKRAGITLLDIIDQSHCLHDLFCPQTNNIKDTKLMAAFDAINQKLGAKSIYFGAQSQGVNHFIKRGLKSPSYTSSWAELLKVS